MTEEKTKTILETIICYKGVKFNTILKITGKELIFKKKTFLSNKYNTVLRVLIKDILVKNDKAKIELDRNDITIITKDERIEFSTENNREAKNIVEIVYSLRTGRRYKDDNKDNSGTLLKLLKGTLAVGGTIALAAGTYKLIERKKNLKKDIVK